jgi:hypothetical protein
MESEMPVPLQGSDQARQSRLEPFAPDGVGGFPQGNELIEDLGLLLLGSPQVALAQGLQEFDFVLLTDRGVHRVPPQGW